MSATKATTPAEARATVLRGGGAMPVFEEEDGQGRVLAVFARDDGKAALKIREYESGRVFANFTADPLTAPDLCRAICEAAGTVPPVMLGRPEVAPSGAVFRGLRVWRSKYGGVTFAIGGNAETLTAAETRSLAAGAVVIADKDDVEPSEAEIVALVAMLRECSAFPEPLPPIFPSLPDVARAILLAGWKRESQ